MVTVGALLGRQASQTSAARQGMEPELMGTMVQLIQETVINDAVFESEPLVQMSRLK